MESTKNPVQWTIISLTECDIFASYFVLYENSTSFTINFPYSCSFNFWIQNLLVFPIIVRHRCHPLFNHCTLLLIHCTSTWQQCTYPLTSTVPNCLYEILTNIALFCYLLHLLFLFWKRSELFSTHPLTSVT